MNEELVAALAAALGLPLPADRVADVTESLEAQIAAGGGSTPDELEGIEPATIFEPQWNRE